LEETRIEKQYKLEILKDVDYKLTTIKSWIQFSYSIPTS
jgi:hypothetical protein